MSALAAAAGVAAGFAAYALYLLIALVTNAVFYQRFGLEIPALADHTLDYWIVAVPAVGGLLVSLMIRYGSPRIGGSGIPHTIEAILVNRLAWPILDADGNLAGIVSRGDVVSATEQTEERPKTALAAG